MPKFIDLSLDSHNAAAQGVAGSIASGSAINMAAALEIDAVIRGCPGVKVSQTVGVPDDLLGELVVACIVQYEGAGLTEEKIKAHAKQTLASYKVPRRVLFFAEDELKTTGSAKIKTADLRKLAAERLAQEG